MRGQREMSRRPDATSPSRAPRVPFALLVVGLIAGGLGLLLALNTASAANELRRHEVAGHDADVAARVQDLRNAVAVSAAPANLEAAAAALGMIPAGNPAFVVVGADGTARVMGKPAAVSAPPVAVVQPRKKPKPTKPATASASATTSGSATTSRSAKPSSAAGTSPSSGKNSSSAKKPKPSVTPTPTPTPVVSLPGGTR